MGVKYLSNQSSEQQLQHLDAMQIVREIQRMGYRIAYQNGEGGVNAIALNDDIPMYYGDGSNKEEALRRLYQSVMRRK